MTPDKPTTRTREMADRFSAAFAGTGLNEKELAEIVVLLRRRRAERQVRAMILGRIDEPVGNLARRLNRVGAKIVALKNHGR